MFGDLPFDLFILLLRVVFVFLLYFFLYQVTRVVAAQLRGGPAAEARPARPATPVMTLLEAGQSELPPGAVFALQPITTIGRAEDNVIILPDTFVSNHHARLLQTKGEWQVVDLNSTNGTFVNDQRCNGSGRPVRDGDIVQIGRLKLKLSLP
jgi:hypothetical protein